MNLTRLVVRLVIVPAFILLGTGCGGLSASRSISPLDFFLPGLIQNEKPQNKVAPVAVNPHIGDSNTVARSL